jgi:uncharacterized membrane protein YhaH (DUF805 family)
MEPVSAPSGNDAIAEWGSRCLTSSMRCVLQLQEGNMDWKWYYSSLEGRIGRKQFWIGAVILAVAGIILNIIVSTLFGAGIANQLAVADGTVSANDIMGLVTRSAWANLVCFLILVYPAAAMMIKRRHDRDNSGMDVWIYLGLTVLLLLFQAFGIGYEMTDLGNGVLFPAPAAWFSVVSALVGIFALYLLVVLGFLKGTEAANNFGSDPLTSAS